MRKAATKRLRDMAGTKSKTNEVNGLCTLIQKHTKKGLRRQCLTMRVIGRTTYYESPKLRVADRTLSGEI
jgi:hypothetical protein